LNPRPLGYEKSGVRFWCLAWSLEVRPAWANVPASGSGVSSRLMPSGPFAGVLCTNPCTSGCLFSQCREAPGGNAGDKAAFLGVRHELGRPSSQPAVAQLGLTMICRYTQGERGVVPAPVASVRSVHQELRLVPQGRTDGVGEHRAAETASSMRGWRRGRTVLSTSSQNARCRMVVPLQCPPSRRGPCQVVSQSS
jgi:hypothetical protein